MERSLQLTRIILLLLLSSPLHLTTSTVYTVTPDDHYYPNTTCHHCHNLQHYLLNVTKYLTSNTQILFLPGLYHLHTDLIIQNVHNISLIGSTANGTTLDTVIQCNSSVAILMTNITNLAVKNLIIYDISVLITDNINVQLSHIKVEGYISMGIKCINILGDSQFSYISSNILVIRYYDTPLDRINHSMLIDHYNIHHNGIIHKIIFDFSQKVYRVNIQIIDTKFSLQNFKIVIDVNFVSEGVGHNTFLVEHCQFLQNVATSLLVLSTILSNISSYTLHGDLVLLRNCEIFDNNVSSHLMKIYNGPDVQIINCSFYRNHRSILIYKVTNSRVSIYNIYTDVIITSSNFSSNIGDKNIFLIGKGRLQLLGPIIFQNNSIENGIIKLRDGSTLMCTEHIQFIANNVTSIIHHDPYTTFQNHFISLKEPVIFQVSNNIYRYFAQFKNNKFYPLCYFQYFKHKQTLQENYHITFENNFEILSEHYAYNNLYIAHCNWLPESAYNVTIPITVNQKYIQYINDSGTFGLLPQKIRNKRLCHCINNNSYDCYKEILGPIFPGQRIEINLFANINRVENFNNVDSDLEVTAISDHNWLPPTTCTLAYVKETVQRVKLDICTKLKYTIVFPKGLWCELFLKTSYKETDKIDVYYITKITCPTGFTEINGTCQCDLSLMEIHITCDINDQTILRPANSWISATTHNNSYTYHISLHCPFHYCLPHSSHLNFSTPNSQCQFNRSGLLCGHCQQGLSAVLSSSQCKQCSSLHLLLIIPIVIAGVILVILLFSFNLSVGEGTINTFILYANIISINNEGIFVRDNTFTPVIMLISFANLDLGIQTCFYNGMDDYAKMWLQLAFPFYLIFIATLIIITSRYSTTVQRLTARRALPVLATLFLLSYTKILRIVSSILFFYSTITHLPSKHTTLVWSVDANVPLLGVKFVIIFSVCMIIFLLMIPFTIILLFIRTMSRFQIINKFKPFLDVYQGPYKDKFYYWTGLQLLIRIVIFGISSLHKDLNFVATTALLGVIVGFHGYCSPLKAKAKNISDLLYYLNLLMLYIFSFYDSNITSIKYILITLAIFHFLITIVYHIITYMLGGVIRNMIESTINIILKWVARRCNCKSAVQQLELQTFPCAIPDVAFNYHDYQETLLGSDYN